MRIKSLQNLIDIFRGKISFIKKIKEYIKSKKLNKFMAKYKYVHLMFNDKFNKPYVDFLNANFDSKKHLILCKRCFKEFPFPKGENVIEVSSYGSLDFKNVQKIYLHSLFDGEVVEYLYEHKDILKKTYWIIWGGDLYNAPRDEKNDFIRKNFKGYISSVKNDEILAKEKYDSNPELYNAPYWGDPMNDVVIKMSQNPEKSDYIRIQINNSSDKSTIEMLEILSKFKDENIRIVTPVSYGDMKYKDEIIKKGKEIFNDKFEYIENLMKPKDYAEHLSKNHILILNQNRQQGGSNAMTSMYFGIKVYCKKEITSFENMKSKGMVPFDTNLIKDISFNEFIEYKKEDREKSQKGAAEFYTGKFALNCWKKVYEE